MEQDRTKRFTALMAAMGEAFSVEASPQKIEIYAQVLSDIPIGEIERAVKQILLSRKTASFPKIAEIREAITGDIDSRAQDALVKVERAMAEHGGYRTIVFDDPVIHTVIERVQGEWVGLCEMEPDEFKWWKKDFLKLYGHHAQKKPEKVAPLEEGRKEHSLSWQRRGTEEDAYD
jgi:hypothetical protein